MTSSAGVVNTAKQQKVIETARFTKGSLMSGDDSGEDSDEGIPCGSVGLKLRIFDPGGKSSMMLVRFG
jgi:hypothetical protein